MLHLPAQYHQYNNIYRYMCLVSLWLFYCLCTYPPIPEFCELIRPTHNMVVMAASTTDPPWSIMATPISEHTGMLEATPAGYIKKHGTLINITILHAYPAPPKKHRLTCTWDWLRLQFWMRGTLLLFSSIIIRKLHHKSSSPRQKPCNIIVPILVY